MNHAQQGALPQRNPNQIPSEGENRGGITMKPLKRSEESEKTHTYK